MNERGLVRIDLCARNYGRRDRLSPMAQPDEIVSQAFLNRLMDIFMESVGPIAPFIVGHHIGLLGESREAFPKSRIGELVKSIAPEISQPESRLRFQEKIAEEIRNLD